MPYRRGSGGGVHECVASSPHLHLGAGAVRPAAFMSPTMLTKAKTAATHKPVLRVGFVVTYVRNRGGDKSTQKNKIVRSLSVDGFDNPTATFVDDDFT